MKKINLKELTFKKFLIIYSSVLAVLMVAFLIYVADSLVKYENNQLDNYVENFITDLKEAGDNKDLMILGADTLSKNEFEKQDASVKRGLQYLAIVKKLTFKQNMQAEDADHPVFDIYADDEPILQLKLNAVDKLTRLGLLSFNVWNVQEVKLLTSCGLFNYEISVPQSYSVEVNGKKLTEDQYYEKEKYAGLSDLSKKINMSYQVKYVIKGMIERPEVKITDQGGQPVSCEEKGTTLTKAVDCQKAATEADAKKIVKNLPNVIEVAEQWSLYLSNDMSGGKNGFETIKKYLIENTYLYQYAYNWATNIDIQLISRHGFDNPPFSDEKVCEFEIYSDKEFSCNVFLQKNMIVSGHKLADKMGERMHFVYIDETDDKTDNPIWKLVSMQAITVK